jgi:chromosome segregation ATPase
LQQKSVPATDPKAEQRVKELETELKALKTKNKEQLEKLKNFAANIKKQQIQCSELEERLAAVGVASDASAANELKAQVIQYEEQISFIRVENSKLQKSPPASNYELNELRQKVDHAEFMLNEKCQEIDGLKQQLYEAFIRCDQLEENLFDRQAHIQKREVTRTACNKE